MITTTPRKHLTTTILPSLETAAPFPLTVALLCRTDHHDGVNLAVSAVGQLRVGVQARLEHVLRLAERLRRAAFVAVRFGRHGRISWMVPVGWDRGNVTLVTGNQRSETLGLPGKHTNIT